MLTIKAHPELCHQYGAIESIAKQAVFWKIEDPVLKGQLAMHNPKSLEEIKQLTTLYEGTKIGYTKKGKRPVRQMFHQYLEDGSDLCDEEEDEWEGYSLESSKWEDCEIRENTDQNRPRGRQNPQREIICYACNKKGHIATHCPERGNKTGNVGRFKQSVRYQQGQLYEAILDKLEQKIIELTAQIAKILDKFQNEQTQAPASVVTQKQNMLKALKEATDALVKSDNNSLN